MIQTHDFPDYDAIASAFGLKKLLCRFGLDSDICYQGTIPIFVRDIFLRTIDIPMMPASSLDAAGRPVIVLDTNPYSSNLTPLARATYSGFIDHHVSNHDPSRSYPFQDLRPAGSTSSIIASYYDSAAVPIDQDTATALAIGLLTDTLNLTRGVFKIDLDSYLSLFAVMDRKKVAGAVMNKLTLKDLGHYRDAIDSLEILGDTALVIVEGVQDRNLLGIMADFFLTLMEVSANVMVNITENGTHISVRSEDEKINSAGLVRAITRELGSGGGHWYMAGGFIPSKVEKKAIHDIIVKIIKSKEEPL